MRAAIQIAAFMFMANALFLGVLAIGAALS